MRPAPLGVPHAAEKFAVLTRHQLWRCPIWLDSGEPAASQHDIVPTELHHRTHNTKVNRGAFPRLIHSMLNLVAVNHEWHMARPYWGRITIGRADEIERTLARWPKACAFVNGQAESLGWKT